jgi:hypothetical protein
MSLPSHEQITLDQIERVLHAADPRLKSMFAAFHHSVRVEAMPAREVIRPRSLRRLLAVCALVIGLLGLLILAVRFGGGDGCPAPPSGRVVTTVATRYPGCLAAWSRVGAR